jgi:hypothetical protein
MEKIMRRFASGAVVLAATLTFGFGLSIPVAGQAQTNGRLVECRIESAGKVEVNGKCRFAPGAGGSFALENANFEKPLFGEILVVSVSIVSPGTAEVRGLTRRGNNSRWGEAQRSEGSPACWEGADFKVCAR